jgi:hypothetical protein
MDVCFLEVDLDTFSFDTCIFTVLFLLQEVRVRLVAGLLLAAEADLAQEGVEGCVVFLRHLEAHQHAADVGAVVAVVEQTHIPLARGLTAEQPSTALGQSGERQLFSQQWTYLSVPRKSFSAPGRSGNSKRNRRSFVT